MMRPSLTFAASAFLALLILATPGHAQVSASISGTVTDPAGAAVPGAAVSVQNTETGAIRAAVTDDAGRFSVLSLAVGEYEVRVTKPNFQQEVRSGIHLAVGQEASVNITMRLGQVAEQVKVEADAPVINPTTAETEGLVGERQLKNLPLNGRSFDQLMTLDPGVVNYTSEKAGGVGISNSTVGNNFAVSGNRPQQNLYLLNGVEFTGAAENNMQPGGTGQELLGVDAVREFNLLPDSYGAEYGKRPGAQILIVTQSGSNQYHGSVYEFLRNSVLDAPNYFDRGGPPPFQRNQFGGSLGGPIQKDKTFFFANYESLRQHLHQTGVGFVPDASARNGTFVPLGSGCPAGSQAACAAAVTSLLNLWPVANGPDQGSGIAENFSNPLQVVRDDFGTARVDHIFSPADTFSAIYTVDDSADLTPTPANPYSTDLESLREQVFSVEETHVFSPTFLNTARFGYSRASYYFTGEATPGTPAAAVPGFVGSLPVGVVVVGGSAAANPAAQISQAGSNTGSNLNIARNLFSYEDTMTLIKGRHQLKFGVWFQQVLANEDLALTQYGQGTFASLTQFLQGTVGNFLYDPAPTQMNWRSLLGAWFVEDSIHLSPNLMVTLGFRDEFTTGWNEANGRAANFVFNNGVIQAQPQVGNSALTANNAKFLPEPRVGVAWSPFGPKTVIRAGFGMYDDLQDALGYRMDQNAPFNPSYGIANLPIADLPLPTTPVPGNAKVLPGGVQPDFQTPTLISYSLKLQQQLSPNTSLSIGYVGSHGYHEFLSLDDNEAAPVICPATPCPATYPGNFPAPLAGATVPAGAYYIPSGTPLANPALGAAWAWFSAGNSSYNAMQADLTRRFSGGLALRGVYTWSKAMDNGDSLNGTAAANAPGLVSNPYNLSADWGPATYNATNVGVISASYDLPFGKGRRFGSSMSGVANKLASGWTVNSIVTAQSGFPFTPQLSYNPSNNGDTRNPVRPFLNPSFSGPVILGTPKQWYNPAAFLAPPPGSGFYGNPGRDTMTGPGLATLDLSFMKDTQIHETLNLEFRAELFNVLNRANFNTPNLIVFTPTGVSPTAGAITSTSTTARQVQFALKLLW